MPRLHSRNNWSSKKYDLFVSEIIVMGTNFGTTAAPLILGTLGATAGVGVGLVAMLLVYGYRFEHMESEGPIVVGAAAGIYFGYDKSSSPSLK